MVELDSNLPIHYSGRFVGSFAYITIKDRLPVIIVKVLDTLCQEKHTIAAAHGEDGKEDVKAVIGRLSALQNEVITNKPIKPLTSDGPDVSLWNNYLDQQNSMHDFPAAWFDSSWLYVECYLYRRMREAFELSSVLKDFDPFFKLKSESLLSALDDIERLGQSLHQTVSDVPNCKDLYSHFVSYLEISLWGNKCDLSISAGRQNSAHSYHAEDLRSKILVNDSQKVWGLLRAARGRTDDVSLHLVLDNAGFELFGDFCLLHFLQSAGLVQRVSLHVKQMPWFVSDTLQGDIDCLLDTLAQSGRGVLADLSRKWRSNLAEGAWRVERELFWTLPHDYSEMFSADPKLYAKLSDCDLVIFKGDLNYRKLTGDRQWDESTPFREALGGFLPTSLVALRTVKANVVVGLPPGTSRRLDGVSPEWKFSGEYAVVQCECREGK